MAMSVITGIFFAVLLAAALFDLVKYMIPNTVSGVLAALFVAAALMGPEPIDWLSHLGAGAAVFAGGVLLYRFRIMGGGDVKFLGAMGLWMGFGVVLNYLMFVAILGGALALLLLGLRFLIPRAVRLMAPGSPANLPELLRHGSHIPYGVAIAGGGVLAYPFLVGTLLGFGPA